MSTLVSLAPDILFDYEIIRKIGFHNRRKKYAYVPGDEKKNTNVIIEDYALRFNKIKIQYNYYRTGIPSPNTFRYNFR